MNKIALMEQKNYAKFYHIFLNVLEKNCNILNSQKLLKKTFYLIWKREKKSPFYIFYLAIENISPVLNFKKATYRNKSIYIPKVEPLNYYKWGILNFIDELRTKKITKKNTFEVVLADLILKCYYKESKSYFKKIALHKDVLRHKLNSRFI